MTGEEPPSGYTVIKNIIIILLFTIIIGLPCLQNLKNYQIPLYLIPVSLVFLGS